MKISEERKLRQLKPCSEGSLIQSLHIVNERSKGELLRIDGIVEKRMDNEGVIGARRKSEFDIHHYIPQNFRRTQ